MHWVLAPILGFASVGILLGSLCRTTSVGEEASCVFPPDTCTQGKPGFGTHYIWGGVQNLTGPQLSISLHGNICLGSLSKILMSRSELLNPKAIKIYI